MKKIGGLLLALVLFLNATSTTIFAADKEARTWQDENFYLVMVDRFFNSDSSNDKGIDVTNPTAFQGGDIKGITAKLDFLKGMGITAVRVSPVFDSEDYAGYQVKDYSKINVHFGQMDELNKLVKEAHKRDMKIVLDLPVNSQPADTIIEKTKKLATEIGIDGYYVYKSTNVTDVFWKSFTTEMKTIKSDFGIFSEDKREGATAYANPAYYNEITNALKKPNHSLKGVYDSAKSDSPTFSYLDNQDTKRFIRQGLDEKEQATIRLKLALTTLYTSPGIPTIYYGTEIALDGGDTPDNRRLMDFKTDEDFLRYISNLGKLRQQIPALRHGDFEMLYDKDGMTIFKRTYKDEVVLSVVNNTSINQKVELTNDQLPGGKELLGVFNDDLIRSTDTGYQVISNRETSNIYVLQNKTGINYGFIAFLILGYAAFFALFVYMKKRQKKRDANK